MLFSASVYASKNDLVKNAVALAQLGIDYYHVDCKNNPTVFEDIKTIRSVSVVPIDLHIISPSPDSFFRFIIEGNIEQVAYQWEDILDKEGFLQQLKALKTKKGIALTTNTPLPSAEVLNCFDFVLLMCTTPGESGGVFDKKNLERILRLKFEHPKLAVHIDGGVNNDIAFVLRLLGVDLIVSGSYLMNHELLVSGMLNLIRTPESLDAAKQLQVKDFMVPKKYLPVLKQNEVDFKLALETIEQYKLGFVMIENGKFEGVVTNADIRRGLLKKINALNDIKAEELVNYSPVCINENESLNDLLVLIRHLNFIILFLPVVDNQNHLKGAILLNNLARG